MPFEPVDGHLLDPHTSALQVGADVEVQRHGVIHQQRDVSPLGEELRLVWRHRPRGDDAYTTLAEFVAMAIRAMENGLAPALGESADGRKLIGHAAGKQNAA